MCIDYNVWIIIINYNGSEDTIECVHSIKKSTYNNLHILIVDNNSTNNETNKLSVLNNTKNTYVVKLDKNIGFGGANNYGAGYALKRGADYIMLLNNDTVIAPNSVEKLLDHADESTITVPEIYYFSDTNKIWYSGGCINYKRGNSTMFTKHHKSGTYEFASGCCMMINKNIILKYGLFDEKYFMYYEDDDFCLKMKENDVDIYMDTNAIIWHKIGKSSDKIIGLKDYYMTRNRLRVIHKYRKYYNVNLCLIYFAISRLVIVLYSNIREKRYMYIWKGICDFYHGIDGKK